MTGETESTTKSKAQLLKQLSRMYEAGISISDISKELKMDQRTIKKLLKLLGYASEKTESTTKSKAQLLKQLSRMYEAGISISDISKELKMDQRTIKKLLKLLGYTSEI